MKSVGLWVVAFLCVMSSITLGQQYRWQDANGGLGGTPAGFMHSNAGILYFGSEYGIVLSSNDSGRTWTYADYPRRRCRDEYPIDSIISIFPDESQSFGMDYSPYMFASADGYIYRTYDYSDSYSYNVCTLPRKGMGAVKTNDGVLYAFDRNGGYAWRSKSEDGGWEQLAFHCSDMVYATNGNIVGHDGNEVLLLKSGTSAWITVIAGDDRNPIVFFHTAASGDVFIVRKSIGTSLHGTSLVYRSADGGETWNKVGALEGVDGVVTSGADGMIYCRTDMHAGFWPHGGGSWVEMPFPESQMMYAYPNGRVVSYGVDGLALSIDSGATWKTTRPCMRNKTGKIYAWYKGNFVYGIPLLLQTDSISYISKDFGLTWEEEPDAREQGIRYTMSRIGYAVIAPVNSSVHGTLVKSTGDDIPPVTMFGLGTLSEIRNVLFSWDFIAIIDNDSIAITPYTSESWERHALPAGVGNVALREYLYSGNASGMWRSTDAGQTWMLITTTPCNGSSLLELEGALIQNEEALYSYDEGETWTQMESDLSPSLQKYVKIAKDFSLTVAMTTEGELTAARYPSDVFHCLTKDDAWLAPVADFVLDYDSIYAVREGGGVYLGIHVWGTPSGTGLTPEPLGISLGEPYPNPALSDAIVEYTLEWNANVTLTVRDVLGRVCAIADNGWREAGTHRVMISFGSLVPGLYFLQLETPQGRISKKMVLMK